MWCHAPARRSDLPFQNFAAGFHLLRSSHSCACCVGVRFAVTKSTPRSIHMRYSHFTAGIPWRYQCYTQVGIWESSVGSNDREKPPVSVLLAGVFGKKSGWNSKMEDPKPTKKFMEMAINRFVERNGGYLAGWYLWPSDSSCHLYKKARI